MLVLCLSVWQLILIFFSLYLMPYFSIYTFENLCGDVNSSTFVFLNGFRLQN